MKSIFITRNITLQREGQEDVVLQKGHHTVADDVAEHPFVKHHVASVTDAGEGVADLQAQLEQTRIAAASEIEQLKEQLATSVRDAARGRDLLQVAHDELADLRTALTASNTELTGALQRAEAAEKSRSDAHAVIAERDAALAAYAAMTPATEAKGKGK